MSSKLGDVLVTNNKKSRLGSNAWGHLTSYACRQISSFAPRKIKRPCEDYNLAEEITLRIPVTADYLSAR